MQDDLVMLGNNLEGALDDEIVKIKFKGDTGKECIFTRNESLVPRECDIDQTPIPNTIIAYNLLRMRWELVYLKDVDIAESIINES